MSMITLRRTGALLGSAVLLASMTVATVSVLASGKSCTYTFPDAGGAYPLNGGVVGEGDVLCGGPGPDTVVRMTGGTFNGGDGDDVVESSSFTERTTGGTFNGGDGDDTVGWMYGGTFNGGDGNDTTFILGGNATFNGGRDIDRVTNGVFGASAFNGGADNDTAGDISGTFNGGRGNDHARRSVGTVAGGPGDDRVSQLCSGVFYGGPGDDSAGVQQPRLSPAPEAYSVENQSDGGSC